MSAKRDHSLMERRRKRAATLFDKGYSAAEVAKRCGVTRQSAGRWKEAWEGGGQQGLASKGPAGRKSRLTAAQREVVTAALIRGPLAQGYQTNLWTLPRIALLVKDLTNVRYHPGHIWHLLRALGFSCQHPKRHAFERDDEEIARWNRVTWPRLKKKPAAKGARSSSSTKVD